jgi:hypothetical protein
MVIPIAALILSMCGAGGPSALTTSEEHVGTHLRANHFVLTPHTGPVGTIVHYRGRLTRRELRVYEHGQPIRVLTTVLEHPQCAVFADMKHEKVHLVTNRWIVRGSFEIGRKGSCQDSGARRLLQPGTYAFDFICVSCQVARFRVTAGN